MKDISSDKLSDKLIEEQMRCFEKFCGNHKHDIKYYNKVDKDYIDDYEAVGVDWTENSLIEYNNGSNTMSLSVCDPTNYIFQQSRQDTDDAINFFKAYINAGGLIILDGKKIWNCFKLVKEIKLLRKEYTGFLFISDEHYELFKKCNCIKELERVVDDFKQCNGDVYQKEYKKNIAAFGNDKRFRAPDLLNDDNIIDYNYIDGQLTYRIAPIWDLTNYLNKFQVNRRDIIAVLKRYLENDGYVICNGTCYYDYETMKENNIL